VKVQVHLDLTAGVGLQCPDCNATMMAGLSHHGRAMVMHAVPICDAFKAKAHLQVRRQVEALGRELQLEVDCG